MTTIKASTVLPVAQSIFQFYVSVMEQRYQSIQGRINHGAKRAMAQGPPP